MTVRSWLYLIARLMGDYNAVKRGPKATQKRLVRKAAGRAFGSFMGRRLR